VEMLIVRYTYFHAEKGMIVTVLALVNLGGETSNLLSYVLQVLQKLYLHEKVIALSADNTNTKFGGKKRKGKNNLYYKLQRKNIKQLDWYWLSCTYDAQCCADCLPVDLQLIINQVVR
jgi:hypothetical protein